MQTGRKVTLLFIIIGFSFFLILQQVFAQSLSGNITTKCERLTFSDLNIAPGDFGGDVKVLGKILNNSTVILENVVIVAEFYDRSGNLSDVSENFPSFSNLDPGDSSPFEVQSSGVGVNESGNITLTCGAGAISPFSVPNSGDNRTTTMDRFY